MDIPLGSEHHVPRTLPEERVYHCFHIRKRWEFIPLIPKKQSLIWRFAKNSSSTSSRNGFYLMRPPRILLGANRNPFVLRQRTSAQNAGNSYIRPKASTFIGYGSTRTRIKPVSVFDNLKAFPFVISLAKMHQSRRRTKPSLGSPATATFVLVAVANFPVLRFVANTGQALAVIL